MIVCRLCTFPDTLIDVFLLFWNLAYLLQNCARSCGSLPILCRIFRFHCSLVLGIFLPPYMSSVLLRSQLELLFLIEPFIFRAFHFSQLLPHI
eukprot:COSAG05_NODE_78_length_21399_cov_26.298216_12_plen_93_part_00